MFLLNDMQKDVREYFEKFTIQNVSIKLKQKREKLLQVSDLQYKMFLLNFSCYCCYCRCDHLQYKMFLLNFILWNNMMKCLKFTIQNVSIKFTGS